MTKTTTQRLTCTRDGAAWGEYLRSGETYTVTVPLNLKDDVHFRNEVRGSGTFMRFHQYKRAIVNGWLLPAAV